MNKQIVQELSQSVEMVYKIECTCCGDAAEQSLAVQTAASAALKFYEEGWRTTIDDTLCPNCAEAEL